MNVLFFPYAAYETLVHYVPSGAINVYCCSKHNVIRINSFELLVYHVFLLENMH